MKHFRIPQKLVAPVLIAGTIIALYSCTLYERREWFGKMNATLWLTGGTLKFARNWYRDGAINDAFLLLERPPSIEFPTLNDRGIYVSYPSGCILPIHLMALLSGSEPTPAMVMAYNCAIHLLVSLLFAFTVFLGVRSLNLGPIQTFFLSMLSAVFYLLSPHTMSLHHNEYFADMAVMLPFAAVVFLEVLLATLPISRPYRMGLLMLQHFFLALGLFTDYLFVFVYISLYLKKALTGELGRSTLFFIRNSLLFSISAILPLGLFLYQVMHFNRMDALADKFLFRTAGNNEGQKYVTDFYGQFWEKFVATTMGTKAIVLVFASVVVIAVAVVAILWLHRYRSTDTSPVARSLLGTCAVVTCACLCQLYFLKNHTVIHPFSALKVSFLIAIVPLGLLPVALAGLTPLSRSILVGDGFECRGIFFLERQLHLPMVSLLLVLFTLGYVAEVHGNYRSIIDRPENREEEIGYFLNRHTRYSDVVFSDTLRIAENPPTLAGLSMKLMYQVTSAEQIRDMITRVSDDANVVFVLDRKSSKRTAPLGPTALWRNAETIDEGGNLVLYRVSRAQFLAHL